MKKKHFGHLLDSDTGILLLVKQTKKETHFLFRCPDKDVFFDQIIDSTGIRLDYVPAIYAERWLTLYNTGKLDLIEK